MELFELARQMADDVWPGRQLSEEADMDAQGFEDDYIPLVAWETKHRPHGILMTAKAAIPGVTWHLCPCGGRMATCDAPSRAQ